MLKQILIRAIRNVPILAASLVAACAIQPLPDDVTDLSTDQISRQITCETREAVIDSILGFLTSDAGQIEFPTRDPQRPFRRVDEHSRQVGIKYYNNRNNIAQFRPGELTGNARYIVNVIWETGVAFNYNLEATEINNKDGSLSILNALPTSTRTFGFSSKLDLQRQNTRIFTIATTFGKLVSQTPPSHCTPQYITRGENIIYPISGKIGLKKLVRDFEQTAIFGSLSGDATKDFSKPTGPAQMAQQLEFTTTIDLSFSPKVTFAPVPLIGSGLHVAEASFMGQAKRTDVHKLTVGLCVPAANLAPARVALIGGLAGVLGVGIVSAPVSTPGEVGALQVLNELITLKLFQVRPQFISR